jgi:hypothetical protein
VASARVHFLAAQIGDKEPDAAVDVEAHAVGADHALILRIEGRDPPYGKAVAPVDVRHGQGRLDNPGKRGHVADLP